MFPAAARYGLQPLSAEELNPQEPQRHANLPQHTLPLLSDEEPNGEHSSAPAAEELPGAKTYGRGRLRALHLRLYGRVQGRCHQPPRD